MANDREYIMKEHQKLKNNLERARLSQRMSNEDYEAIRNDSYSSQKKIADALKGCMDSAKWIDIAHDELREFEQKHRI